MFEAVISMVLLGVDTADPIQVALDHFHEVTAYRATVKSISNGKTEVIRYYFKKPGYVRMEFVAPFKGAVLVYDPISRLAKLWPFGYGSFPAIRLSPNNRLIQSSTGQRVDRSDVGVLYQNVKNLQRHGMTDVQGIETLDGHEVLQVEISSAGGFSLEGIFRYRLWLDRVTAFPLKVMSHARDGRLIETVELQGLVIDSPFPDGFFRQ